VESDGERQKRDHYGRTTRRSPPSKTARSTRVHHRPSTDGIPACANFRAARSMYSTQHSRNNHLPGRFVDSQIRRVFAPFNVQGIGQNVYVTTHSRTQRNTTPSARGLGFVRVQFPMGSIARLKTEIGSTLPGRHADNGDFGTFSHKLLVGNFSAQHSCVQSADHHSSGDVQRPTAQR